VVLLVVLLDQMQLKLLALQIKVMLVEQVVLLGLVAVAVAVEPQLLVVIQPLI